MCTRYTIASSSNALEEEFHAEFQSAHNKIYNAHFGLELPVIRSGDDNKIVLSRWGLIPFWAKEPNLKSHNINAQARNIVKNHAYRIPIRRRRCLVLANCYFIWTRLVNNKKTPFLVYDSKQRIMSFAGIWDIWTSFENDRLIESFSIITTHSNSRLQKHSPQMPVIIPTGQRRKYLKQSTPLNEIMSMLRPMDSSSINLYPVSQSIDDFHNNTREVVMPVGERIYNEYMYSPQAYLKLEGMGSMKDNPERKPKIKVML